MHFQKNLQVQEGKIIALSLVNYNQRLHCYALDFRKGCNSVMVTILTASILDTQKVLLFCVRYTEGGY